MKTDLTIAAIGEDGGGDPQEGTEDQCLRKS
jgi:hypothetical protein